MSAAQPQPEPQHPDERRSLDVGLTIRPDGEAWYVQVTIRHPDSGAPVQLMPLREVTMAEALREVRHQINRLAGECAEDRERREDYERSRRAARTRRPPYNTGIIGPN